MNPSEWDNIPTVPERYEPIPRGDLEVRDITPTEVDLILEEFKGVTTVRLCATCGEILINCVCGELK
jgi:hypothetical protein